MCGIVGFLNLDRSPISRSMLEKMNACLAHRGPDDTGMYLLGDNDTTLVDRSYFGFGHQRLAIVDLSSTGHQPMFSSNGRYVIVLNGEIYNHEHIRHNILRENPQTRFRGTSDTETILEAFSLWGEKAISQFIGMFALAIYDLFHEELFVYRDRLGIKPLYYFWDGIHFAFGSELSSIQPYQFFERSIDIQALAFYLTLGYIPSPMAIFNHCHKLKPGGCIRVNMDGIFEDEYWSINKIIEDKHEIDAPEEDLVDQLDELLRDSVKLRLLSDVPIGGLLSGGIDSSTVIGIMQAISSNPVKTFTIGFFEPKNDEAPFAKQVAAYLGTDHHEHYLSAQDIPSLVTDAITNLDEPLADSSLLPTLIVSAFARRFVTVALAGDGGDELFCGYGHYLRFRRYKRWLPLFQFLTLDVFQKLMRQIPIPQTQVMATIAHIQTPFDIYFSMLTTIRPSHFRDIFLKNSNDQERILTQYRRDRGERFNQQANALEAAGQYDLQTVLPHQLLTKVDRASMRHALEVRVPILDHRVVEFSLNLPFSMKYRGGVTKYILRQVLKRYVPDELVNRPKMGFAPPLDQWNRGVLRPLIEQYLGEDSLKKDNLFDPLAIKQLLNEYYDHQYHHAGKIWALLLFQMWLTTH